MKKTNGEGSIWTEKRNGKQYYRGAVTVGFDTDGRPIRKTVGSYKKIKVIEKLNELRYQAQKKLLSSNPDINFGDVFYSWMYEYKKNEIQNNTFAEYEVCYRLRIKPYSISKIKMNEIDLEMLQRYFNELKKDNLSISVIKKTYIKINSCFEFAYIHGIINKNFCKGIVIPKLQKKKEDAYKVFTKEEQELIIQKLDLRNVLDCLIYFDFFTGLRLGEVLAVKWSRIQDNMLSVKEQYQKDVRISEAGKRETIYIFKDMLKTRQSIRDIPLPKRILEMLNHIQKWNDLIFCDEHGKPIERKRPDRRLKRICREVGIDDSRTFHSIRHTYATRLFEMDVPIKTVQALLGHSDIQTTMNIYTHVMHDKKIEVLSKLDTL